ncbi:MULTISPECIES: hypothetical protein [Metabacillus]|uniref:Spore coat protein n=3 Tax=Metabacillus TaxID=2675233 RepID=A0A179T2K0_9BACI|nr:MULTISPECIES: hypothetical protein [Metabacillus]OAS87658.1 hypothetical protein A6K24_19660 [Metabacillus litoralis]QNF26940.1 hypothetical protein HUW50_04915 [Metabacillus sp. KUDC1714]
MQQQQNMQQQQQQTMMQQPPSIVTTKDQLYLTDMLSWNLLAMKKAHFFASQCQNQEIKNQLDQVGQMHHQHYQKILTHLQNQQQPSAGSQLQ